MNCQTIRETIDTASRRAGYGETVHTHLGGCSDCRRHADETSSLLALLNAQPRVEAPADFDFRLRARIARAQSEPQVAAGLLERFRAKSFSLGRAATAMAAITVALTASTIYLTNPNEVATPSGPMIAENKTPPQVETVVSNTAQPVRAARAATGRATYRSVKHQAIQPASITTAVASAVAGKVDNSASFYSRGNRQVITASLNRDLIGAEGAGLAKSQTPLSF